MSKLCMIKDGIEWLRKVAGIYRKLHGDLHLSIYVSIFLDSWKPDRSGRVKFVKKTISSLWDQMQWLVFNRRLGMKNSLFLSLVLPIIQSIVTRIFQNIYLSNPESDSRCRHLELLIITDSYHILFHHNFFHFNFLVFELSLFIRHINCWYNRCLWLYKILSVDKRLMSYKLDAL